MTDVELSLLIKEASARFGLLLRFACLTGMRQLDLTLLDLAAVTAEGIRYIDSKTKKQHLIAWTDELSALWKEIAGMRIGSQPSWQRYTTDGLKASWRHVKLRAGLKDVRFLDIRRDAVNGTRTGFSC